MPDVQELITKLSCGGVASATSKTLFAPLERVKILLQTKGTTEKLYVGVLDILKYLVLLGKSFSTLICK